jgi:hypothetical protein
VGRAETTNVAVRSTPWWRWAFISVVMFSLIVALATRTFHDRSSSNTTTVESGGSQAMRQHMDRDAARWLAPVAKVTGLQTPTFSPGVAPAGSPLPILLIEENLFDRPPPAC